MILSNRRVQRCSDITKAMETRKLRDLVKPNPYCCPHLALLVFRHVVINNISSCV